VQIMVRMACHTGQIVTWDEALNHEQEFAPDLDKLTMDSLAPLQLGPDAKRPLPQRARLRGESTEDQPPHSPQTTLIAARK
jgi:hypothetical protein